MCTVLAIAGEKGGTGKTTLALNIASELHARGRRVLLVDADPQGTSTTWAGIAAESGVDGPTTIAMGEQLRAQLGRAVEGYDWCVIDCPGRGGKRQVGALMVADVALLPCGPSPADAWALGASVDLIGEVREMRPELRAAIVLNRCNRTAIGKSTRDAIAQLTTTLPTLRSTLGDRVAFREALASGDGVTGYASGTVAANELRRLVDEIETMTKGSA